MSELESVGMHVHLVTGGARSGKSRYAEQLASDRARAAGNGGVTYIATAEAGDDEMRDRIDEHRRRRAAAWTTVEASRDAAAALLAATTAVVLLDCLTLLAANAFLSASDGLAAARGAVDAEMKSLIDATRRRAGELIVVTNEVGFGIVPANEQARWFRDVLGVTNCMMAERAERVTLVVAGCPLRVRG